MIPYIHITIPSYGLLAVIGLLAAMYWLYYQAILKGQDFLTFRQFLLLAGCSLAGCVIGSKLLFGITQLPEIAAEASWQAAAKAFVFGGFVFYGGLLGGLAGAAVFARAMLRAEFFRGDTERGIWLILSTSQCISILIVISLMLHWIRCKAIAGKKPEKPINQEETE